MATDSIETSFRPLRRLARKGHQRSERSSEYNSLLRRTLLWPFSFTADVHQQVRITLFINQPDKTRTRHRRGGKMRQSGTNCFLSFLRGIFPANRIMTHARSFSFALFRSNYFINGSKKILELSDRTEAFPEATTVRVDFQRKWQRQEGKGFVRLRSAAIQLRARVQSETKRNIVSFEQSSRTIAE